MQRGSGKVKPNSVLLRVYNQGDKHASCLAIPPAGVARPRILPQSCIEKAPLANLSHILSSSLHFEISGMSSAPRLRGLISAAATTTSRHLCPLNTVESAVGASRKSITRHTTFLYAQRANMASTTTDQPAAAPAAAEAANPVAKTEEPKPAPKLSEHDFRIFNQIAVRMDYFVRIYSSIPLFLQPSQLESSLTNTRHPKKSMKTFDAPGTSSGATPRPASARTG